MTLDEANALCQGTLAGLVGIVFTDVAPGRTVARLEIRPDLLAPNGFLHGSTVIALAETACGIGTACTLGDERRDGFASVDLSCNFVGTARDGVIVCEAVRLHSGRTTQVWDARVWREADGRSVGFFRCTQILLAGL